MQGKPRLRGCRERIAVLAAGLSAYSMAGTLARMAQASHAPSQPSHARPKSLPLARGDAAKAGRDEEQALAFSRTKNTVGLCCGPEFPRSPKKSLRRSARLENGGTWQRFRTGKLPATRTLDLHGHTAQRAFHALGGFLRAAYADRVRCVEVITGRGSGEHGGVIRWELPMWLNSPQVRPLVLAAAHPHAANPGSVRLLLRRRRSG